MNAKESFADLKFRIECSQIILRQQCENGLVVHGPGEIWQDEKGVLQYKIFTNQAGYRGLHAYMKRPGVIGQLIPDQDYFLLEAQEHSMPIWSAERISPAPRGGPREGLAYGYIKELTQKRAIPVDTEADYLEVRFKGKLDFPCNAGTQIITRVRGEERRFSTSFNVAFVEDGNYHFEFLHDSNHTVVSVTLPPGELTPATASRVHEALQFILGKQLVVMVIETSCAGKWTSRFISPSLDRGHGEMQPPLEFSRLNDGGHVWRMFCNYFRWIHRNTSPGWHPISNHIGRVIESTAASLDTEILALGVAVEGLAGECFPGLAPVKPDFLSELDAVEATLKNLKLIEQSRSRIRGTINAMRSPRNSDILRAFLRSNRLSADFFESWRRLRNTSAHGGGAGGDDVENILRLRNEVLSLLYSIVFAVINYTGPRTDYSERGWPRREWPVPLPPPETLPLANPAGT